jgi:hypothetical protein
MEVLRWAIEHGCPVSQMGVQHYEQFLA